MTELKRFAINADDRRRIQAARVAQAFDADPPRCFTCVYYHRGPINPVRKLLRGEKGPASIEMCKFGNFPVTYHAVCDEWRNRAGEHIEQEPVAGRGNGRG